ncbi:minor tail protein [Gordonia Phage Sephiroth]|uniref:Minor tail protein n=2 Tax=Octobienvirus TaxID=3044779 RepID=A0AAE9C2A6_9CAUD|nr:minor tail protein [Gordonia Phage Sephiroth]YP_010246548.1 minor tail protein [Gordonia phage Kudefre]QNN99374.1 minor tail protein [Gordonia Phage Sephiroth]UDL15263.1 minor tail protein [Gordonia phage Kudefre]
MLVPSGSVNFPSGAFPVGAGGAARAPFEGRTESAVKGLLKTDHKPEIDEAFSGFNSGLVGVLQRVLMGTGTGPLTAGLAWLRDLMKNRWDQVDETQESVVSVGTQVHYVQEVIALQSGMGVWETGPDRTGTPSFPFGLLNLTVPSISVSVSGGSHSHNVTGSTGNATAGGDSHNHSAGSLSASSTNSTHSHTATVDVNSSVPTVNVTSSYAPWANVIFKSAAERKVITFLAYRTGTVSSFNIDVYKLEADGSSSIVYSSPDLSGNLTGAIGWQQHLMSGSILADLGDAYDVQFRMTGSGSVSLAGINFPNPTPLPGFRPYASGSARNASTTPAPATIPTATRDTMYVGPTPFVSIGIDVGQTTIPRFVFDDFNRAALGNVWIPYGSIGISSNRVTHTGSALVNNSSAAMRSQPMATDAIEVAADLFVDTHAAGIGLCCGQGMTGGAWLVVEDNDSEYRGIRIMTGNYDNRVARASLPGTPVSGRYTLRYTPSDNTYRAYAGASTTEPILSWVDSGNVVQHGIGRRWVGMVTRRAFTFASGRIDNFTAADV